MYLDPTIDSRSLDPRISKTFRVEGLVEFRDVRACAGYCPRSSWNIRDEKQTIFGVIALFEVQSVWSDLTFTLLILILPVGKICSGRKTWFEWVHQSVNLDQRIQVSNWSKEKKILEHCWSYQYVTSIWRNAPTESLSRPPPPPLPTSAWPLHWGNQIFLFFPTFLIIFVKSSFLMQLAWLSIGEEPSSEPIETLYPQYIALLVKVSWRLSYYVSYSS